jgi:HK97 family phage prohead protease
MLDATSAKALSFAPTEESKNGYLEGYVAVYGNIDSYGDRIVRGALAKSISERVPAGKVPLVTRHFAHGGDGEDAIGLITQAREDDYGLWIHAEYSADPEAQRMRAKIEEGIVWGLSIGYELVKWQEVKEGERYVLEILEMKFLEGTVTCRPANELAVITAAKSLRNELPAGDTDNGHPPHATVKMLSDSIDAFLAAASQAEPKTAPLPTQDASVDFTLLELENAERHLELLNYELQTTGES